MCEREDKRGNRGTDTVRGREIGTEGFILIVCATYISVVCYYNLLNSFTYSPYL